MTTAPRRGASRNRWRAIAADMRACILAGAYAPGDRLPSNARLRARYGVSGQTVQHAMNSLRGEGLVETRPGLGWFVRRPPDLVSLPRPVHPGRSSPKGAGPGCAAGEDARVHEVTTVLRHEVASARVATELRIEPGAEVLVRARTVSEDGEVVALAASYFPRALTRGTAIEDDDTGPGGALACLIRLGHEVVQHVERVTAGPADDEEAKRFGRTEPPLVVRVVRVTSSRTAVLGMIRIVVLAERFELCYELPVPRRSA